METNIGTADNLEPPTQLHRQALFGPTANAREKARKQIRANSVKGPDFWNTLDGAFIKGYLNPRPDDGTSVRANAQLYDYDEWVNRSDEIIEEVEVELTLLDDAMGIDTVGSDLSFTIYTEQAESQMQQEASVSMDGQAKGDEDDTATVPVGIAQPIIHVDYSIGARDQAQSENMGSDKEAKLAEEAGRLIREKEDDIMANGWGLEVEGPNGQTFGVDGYLNTDARITGSAPDTWGDGSTSNLEAPQDTIEKMVSDLETVGANDERNLMPRSRGVYLYYNQAHNSTLDKSDPRGDGNMSIRQRIQQDHPYVTLRETPFIPESEVVMVVRDSRVMSVVNAQGPTNLSWEPGPMATRYKALSSRVPFFRSTYDDILGVVDYDGVA
ncbi:major capsid protein [Halovenus marina]|uniref:major capsid protein n=1 Tax=Halovenus marina TaxID=3396621 RepID=UPI003F5442F8